MCLDAFGAFSGSVFTETDDTLGNQTVKIETTTLSCAQRLNDRSFSMGKKKKKPVWHRLHHLCSHGRSLTSWWLIKNAESLSSYRTSQC